MLEQKKILFIASFPPPYHGANVDSHNLVKYWNSRILRLIPFDISDKKKSGKDISKFRLNNIITALKGIFKYFRLMVLKGKKGRFFSLSYVNTII